jgi:hypothetical protein
MWKTKQRWHPSYGIVHVVQKHSVRGSRFKYFRKELDDKHEQWYGCMRKGSEGYRSSAFLGRRYWNNAFRSSIWIREA